jgi:hypothetical protein
MAEAMFDAFVKYKTEMEGGVNTAKPIVKTEPVKPPSPIVKIETEKKKMLKW